MFVGLSVTFSDQLTPPESWSVHSFRHIAVAVVVVAVIVAIVAIAVVVVVASIVVAVLLLLLLSSSSSNPLSQRFSSIHDFLAFDDKR